MDPKIQRSFVQKTLFPVLLEPAELGAPSANLVEETRRKQQNNDEIHVDAGLTVRSVDCTGYPTNRTLSFPEPKSYEINETEPRIVLNLTLLNLIQANKP